MKRRELQDVDGVLDSYADLAPTREELLAWREAVAEVVERTERAGRTA